MNILYKLKFSKANINLPLVSRELFQVDSYQESKHARVAYKIEKYSIPTESTDAELTIWRANCIAVYLLSVTYCWGISESFLIKIETLKI